MSRRGPVAPSIAVLLVSLVLVPAATLVAATGFDGLYGQDSIAYFRYAVGPLRESLLRLEVPPPFFWPLGFPSMVAGASLVLGPTPSAGQVVALLGAALVPVGTWRLAAWTAAPVVGRGRAERVALLAGVVVALTGQLWQSGIVVMSDAPGLAFATLSAWALARWDASADRRWLLLSAAALAAALWIRWGFGLLGPPWALVIVLHAARRRAFARVAVDAAAAGLVGAALLLPLVAAALAHGPGAGHGWMAFAGDLGIQAWTPAYAFRRSFDTVDGRLSYDLPNGLYYLTTPFHAFYLTPLLAPAAVFGAILLVRRRAWSTAALLLGWAGAFYVFHAGAAWQNFRFPLAWVPPLAVLAALGCDDALERLRPRRRRVALVALAGILLLQAASAARLVLGFVARKEHNLELVRWVEERLPSEPTLVTFGETELFRHYTRFDVRDLHFLSGPELRALDSGAGETFVLADVGSLETQWRSAPAGIGFRSLRQEGRLEHLGRKSGWTLFRLAAPRAPEAR